YGRRPETWGLAAVEMSAGRFRVADFQGKRARQRLADEIARLQPAELLLPEGLDVAPAELVDPQAGTVVTRSDDTDYREKSARELLCEQFGVHDLTGFGIEQMPAPIRAAGALLRYLRLTQRRELTHLTGLEVL